MFQELLLIDPDQEILDTFKRFLERHGYSVATAASGPEATGELRRRRPALIVIEPVMSDHWGEKILEEYRHSSPGVPVIGLSKRRCCTIAFPFCVYFVKPISMVQLLEGIQSALSSSGLQILS